MIMKYLLIVVFGYEELIPDVIFSVTIQLQHSQSKIMTNFF